MRLPILIFLLGTAGFLALIWSMPHYAAPLTGVIFLLLIQAMRHLRTIRLGGRPLGLALSWAIFTFWQPMLVSLSRASLRPIGMDLPGMTQCRAAIGKRLFQTPGKHLIMVALPVRITICNDEWVYNEQKSIPPRFSGPRTRPRPKMQGSSHISGIARIWLVRARYRQYKIIPLSTTSATCSEVGTLATRSNVS